MSTANLTPMLRQYQLVKAQYPDALVLFRLGDFFELFGEDAEKASGLLQITLTSREIGKGQRLPMCGVPHHAVWGYVAQLVRAGHKVAVCDQMEDPRQAKGVVRREVVRVVTPGTVVEEGLLQDGANNYLAALCWVEGAWGLSAADVSTGEWRTTQLESSAPQGPAFERCLEELVRLGPAECLVPGPLAEEHPWLEARLVQGAGLRVERVPADEGSPSAARSRLLGHLGVRSLEAFGCEQLRAATAAAGMVLAYVERVQRQASRHLVRLRTYSLSDTMLIDASTRRNLELFETIRTRSRKGSLLGVLDRTRTAAGARFLRRALENPLLRPEPIRERLDAVEAALNDPVARARIRDRLRGLGDIERLTGRAAVGTAGGREMALLRAALQRLGPLRQEVLQLGRAASRLAELGEAIDEMADLRDLLERALAEDPPANAGAGGLIRPGYDVTLDQLRERAALGKEWIASLEARERERTGIRSLRVGFNKVFGYYLEVTRPNLSLVPADWERRQTLAGAERFVTPELKEWEAQVLGAEERIAAREMELFAEIRDRVAAESARLQATAAAVAELDFLLALAEVAAFYGYVRPKVDRSDRIEILEGRHPVVEALNNGLPFVPNDVRLDEQCRLVLLTGPNMGGKSTYLRQVALCVLLAQIGSFVPARRAHIGIVDRIFTRVGAADDLATGQSTFMVEMNEVAYILHHATEKSLVILDEVGRGTSTFDGVSLAWAVVDHLLQRVRSKALFATHYHELTALEGQLPGLRNFQVTVTRSGEEVIFLHRVVPGAADRSYGIEVARLAGLPEPVIRRAREVLAGLELTRQGGAALPAPVAAAGGLGAAAAREGDGAGTAGQPTGPAGEATGPQARQLPLFSDPQAPIEAHRARRNPA